MKLVSVIMDEDRKVEGLSCKDKSLAQQSAAGECDINEIVRKFEKTGLITHVSSRVAQYGDFSDIPDYRAALDLVRNADAAFMALPAFIRERFDNDPAKFVDFCGDPKNEAEAVKLGILEAKPVSKGVDPKNEKEAVGGQDTAAGSPSGKGA